MKRVWRKGRRWVVGKQRAGWRTESKKKDKVLGQVMGQVRGHVRGQMQGQVLGRTLGRVLGRMLGRGLGQVLERVLGQVLGRVLGRGAGTSWCWDEVVRGQVMRTSSGDERMERVRGAWALEAVALEMRE